MSEVTLTVRDDQRSINHRVHGSLAKRFVAALSADPETMEELARASLRFQAGESWNFVFEGWRAGDCDEPWDAGVYIIDLPARLVMGNSTYFDPAHTGSVDYHNGRRGTDLNIRYHLADEWEIVHSLDGWERHAQQRRRQFASQRRIDSRVILFDKFYEYAVEQCLHHAARSSENPVVMLHRQWLTTPRPELNDRAPREVLLADQYHLDLDLQYREHQWSQSGTCPPGIPTAAAAYRFGGIGTHEWVLHYEFARFVLQECWASVQQRPYPRPAAEKHRLAREGKTWLRTPQPDMNGLSPIEVIERERRRIPLAVAAEDAVVDDDCPLCQMMLESAGPCFWHLDGCQMEDEFAFSCFLTRDEWDDEQRESDQAARQFDAARILERLPAGECTFESLWQKGDNPNSSESPISLQLALFRIGAFLAELDSILKQHHNAGPAVELLNRHFGNLRESASNTRELIAPVVSRFCQDLEDVSHQYPELVDKCTDLQDALQLLAEQIAHTTS